MSHSRSDTLGHTFRRRVWTTSSSPLAECRAVTLLRIWGRERGAETAGLAGIGAEAFLAQRAAASRLDGRVQEPRHRFADVFNHCDTIVVPSIWAENSPLVIHEALQARSPRDNCGPWRDGRVCAHHERNGLLFAHRDSRDSLALQMQRMANDPHLARLLGRTGLPALGRRQRPGHD